MELTEKLQKKLNDGREYRSMLVNVADNDEEDYVVEGYATTFNQPYHLYFDKKGRDPSFINDIILLLILKHHW